MNLELYNARQSTCSQRVRLALNEKGLAFKEHLLDLLSGDQFKPDYVKINKNSLVPTLIHDGRAVIDSSVILEYLEETFPEDGPSFVPDDPYERAQMRAWMRFIDEVPAAAIRVPSYNLGFLRAFEGMSDEEFLAFAESKPLRRDFMIRMGRTGFPDEDMDKAMAGLRRAVVRMHDALEDGRPWLMGEQFTFADIMVMPAIIRMDDLDMHKLFEGADTVIDWIARLKARPAYEKTYYHGSYLTEMYPGILEERRAKKLATSLSA